MKTGLRKRMTSKNWKKRVEGTTIFYGGNITCIHTHIYMCIYIYIYIFIYTCICILIYMYIYTYIYTYKKIHTHTYVCINVLTYLYICAHIYIHVYHHTPPRNFMPPTHSTHTQARIAVSYIISCTASHKCLPCLLQRTPLPIYHTSDMSRLLCGAVVFCRW